MLNLIIDIFATNKYNISISKNRGTAFWIANSSGVI